MDQDSAAQLVTAAVATRVFACDGVRLLRRVLSVGVRIGIADLAARAGRGAAASKSTAGEGR
ncbi:hypothetical protein [Kitasatospora sp. NPDC047058]|uniref:hypothetical protein n=1 Tax=Kitasatospora sp. NPDC047058 TaxID=3155620 RepID=UPI0033F070BE